MATGFLWVPWMAMGIGLGLSIDMGMGMGVGRAVNLRCAANEPKQSEAHYGNRTTVSNYQSNPRPNPDTLLQASCDMVTRPKRPAGWLHSSRCQIYRFADLVSWICTLHTKCCALRKAAPTKIFRKPRQPPGAYAAKSQTTMLILEFILSHQSIMSGSYYHLDSGLVPQSKPRTIELKMG